MILAALLVIIIFLIYLTFYSNKGSKKYNHRAPDNGHSMSHQNQTNGCDRQYQQPQPSLNCAENQANGYVEEHYDKPYASDYSEFMVNTGLESSIVESHKTFTDGIQNNTTGASAQSVLSHDDSIVPYWGLRRRSAYIPIDPNSREVPSQTNEQINQNSGKMNNCLF